MSSIQTSRSQSNLGIDTIHENGQQTSSMGSLFRKKKRPSTGDLKLLSMDDVSKSQSISILSPTIPEADQNSIEEDEEFDLLSMLNSNPTNKNPLAEKSSSSHALSPNKSKFKLSSESINKSSKEDLFGGHLRFDGKDCYCKVDETCMVAMDSNFALMQVQWEIQYVRLI
jgi:hypothetical protein